MKNNMPAALLIYKLWSNIGYETLYGMLTLVMYGQFPYTKCLQSPSFSVFIVLRPYPPFWTLAEPLCSSGLRYDHLCIHSTLIHT